MLSIKKGPNQKYESVLSVNRFMFYKVVGFACLIFEICEVVYVCLLTLERSYNAKDNLNVTNKNISF